jgi:hypothetical protein
VNIEIDRAERSQEVRDAARKWAGGKLIDRKVLDFINAAYADDRRRLNQGGARDGACLYAQIVISCFYHIGTSIQASSS